MTWGNPIFGAGIKWVILRGFKSDQMGFYDDSMVI
jgi:hypothetical protein